MGLKMSTFSRGRQLCPSALSAGFKAAVLSCLLGAWGVITPEQANAKAPRTGAIAAAAATNCKDDPSEKAAQLAREKYPDSLAWPNPSGWTTQQLWAARTRFLRENTWALFDADHDGRIEFEEYHTMQWALLVSAAPAGQCVVTRDVYMSIVIGKPGEPGSSWDTKWMTDALNSNFDMYDRNRRGSLVKEDMRIFDQAVFHRGDKDHPGYLTKDQHF